ncbi:MAG: phospholipase D family protein [Verrucomicrobiales bacterium]|nr:phospholipase D family protein [Verrucomicrobiales bacterium]
MEFIRNTARGSQLDTLNRAAIPGATSVEAAVAYVTDTTTLLESCWKAEKPLTLYARYDHTGPVAPQVLEWFLSHRKESVNCELYLVPDGFHPKLIWWKGAGAYVGSANLSMSAWGGNVEAGLYLSEDELSDHDLVSDVETFFSEVREIAHPLTKELAEELIELATGEHAQALEKARKKFEATRKLPRRPSLISVTKRSAKLKRKEAFLREWADTLQTLRDIGHRLAKPANLPRWLPEDAPPGVLADQFLHAFYYNRVRDGVSYPFREMFQTNKDNREAALQDAFEWWRNLPAAPSNEDLHVTRWAARARELLARESLRVMSVEAFQELCLLVHGLGPTGVVAVSSDSWPPTVPGAPRQQPERHGLPSSQPPQHQRVRAPILTPSAPVNRCRESPRLALRP